MDVYRAYVLDEHGRVATLPHVLKVISDEEAVAAGWKLVDTRVIEIWQGSRRFAVLNPHDKQGSSGRQPS